MAYIHYMKKHTYVAAIQQLNIVSSSIQRSVYIKVSGLL